MGKAYAGDVKFIRVEDYDRDNRNALLHYHVRATSTFVLLDSSSQVQLNVAGWPGSPTLIDAFEQTLAGG